MLLINKRNLFQLTAKKINLPSSNVVLLLCRYTKKSSKHIIAFFFSLLINVAKKNIIATLMVESILCEKKYFNFVIHPKN